MSIFEGQMKAVAWPCLKKKKGKERNKEIQFGNSETDLSKLCKFFSEQPRHVEKLQRRWGKPRQRLTLSRSLLG